MDSVPVTTSLPAKTPDYLFVLVQLAFAHISHTTPNQCVYLFVFSPKFIFVCLRIAQTAKMGISGHLGGNDKTRNSFSQNTELEQLEWSFQDYPLLGKRDLFCLMLKGGEKSGNLFGIVQSQQTKTAFPFELANFSCYKF